MGLHTKPRWQARAGLYMLGHGAGILRYAECAEGDVLGNTACQAIHRRMAGWLWALPIIMGNHQLGAAVSYHVTAPQVVTYCGAALPAAESMFVCVGTPINQSRLWWSEKPAKHQEHWQCSQACLWTRSLAEQVRRPNTVGATAAVRLSVLNMDEG